MIKAGIIGGSGYTGGELIRLLLNHPKTEIDFVYSTTRAGKPITSAHQDLLGQTELKFSGSGCGFSLFGTWEFHFLFKREQIFDINKNHRSQQRFQITDRFRV